MHGKTNQSHHFFSIFLAQLSSIGLKSVHRSAIPLHQPEKKPVFAQTLSLLGLLLCSALGACEPAAVELAAPPPLVDSGCGKNGALQTALFASLESTGVPSLDGDFERRKLMIESDDGACHELDIYLAIDVDQQRRGLMFVRKMPENTGMLFVYELSEIRSMWMKNTYIPLDMVFARADGTVSSVIYDTQPLSLTSQGSIEPVNYVLEFNAGTARRLNIGQNSRISWEPVNQ